ncbi:MAG: lamin tail domain-containing protein [Prevotella sp.]|nr:lamin tail domain-containing protein [Prevotella sp.]
MKKVFSILLALLSPLAISTVYGAGDNTSTTLVINEVMASNAGVVMSPATNFDSWIEIYNPDTKSINLSGMYLSNDANNLTKWKMPNDIGTVPAKGYLVVWMGSDEIKSNQAPFKLDCDGGTICLSDKNGQLITSVEYPEAMSRTSWARTADGEEGWNWTADATPGATNATAVFTSNRLDAPVVSAGSQLINGTLTFHVDIPDGATLMYSTDGSVPTAAKEGSPTRNCKKSSDGKFTVTWTTNYVFRLFKDGYLPSVPVTRSFIQTSNNYTIPIVSVVGDERYFTDPVWGIDVEGTNGISGKGSDRPVNWNQPWDRPVNFSYISPTEGMLFNQDVNISVSGGWTRNINPRSMKLKSNKVFDGQNRFNYSFFPQKPFIRSKALLIRNGGNDVWNNHARFTDPALATIIQRSGIDLDVQSFIQVAEYINGEFKGILNLREPSNDKFVYANFGYDDEEIDMFENSTFTNGNDKVYNRLVTLSERINETGVYDEVKTMLDIDEFTNYMATELYLGNDDWPDNNVKAYRSQADGRYRFVCYDLDYAFNAWDHRISSLDDYSHIKMIQLFKNLLKHNEYRKKFIDTFCIVAGSVFEKSRATAIINELADGMRPMSQLDGYTPDNAANKMKDKLSSRLENLTSQLQQYQPMQLNGAQKQSVTLSADVEDATIFVNGIQVPYASFNGRLFTPVTLEAKAPAGYTFAGWKKTTGATIQVIKTNDTWKYYDKGQQNGTSWRSKNFNDASWSSGQAPLGYKTAGVKTTVSYGNDPENRHPTTYFRKSVTLNGSPTSNDSFTLNYQVDDGFIIWVNGQDAGRVNMPNGDVDYNTFTTSYAAEQPITGTLELSPTLFKKGENTIAVEVHNNKASSSDLFWTCELITTVGADTGEAVLTDSVINLPDGNKISLVACFEPMTDNERKEQGLTPVCINEVSAANGIYVNEYYKRNDWVELYNTTDAGIDVEGMYLTDNLNKPKKYQITGNGASTIIPAHGYLVVWCDKLEPLTQLHTSFKLDAEGGDVMLTAADESWNNSISYHQMMKSDESVGRYPDGSNHVYLMNIPTIAKANILSSYVVHLSGDDPSGINEMSMTNTPSISMSYARDRLLINSDLSIPAVKLGIYNITGQLLSQQTVSLTNGYAEQSLDALSSGCYIARLSDGHGHHATCKFIKR